VIAIAAAGAVFYALSKQKNTASSDGSTKEAAQQDMDRTFTLKKGELVLGINQPGTVSAKKKHRVVPQANVRTTIVWIIEENAKVKKGDFVIIQFGHNDQKKKNPQRYAAADGEFKDNLRKFINEVRAKGASPVLATSISRRAFGKDGKLTDRPNLREYANATIDIANEMKVPYVDLNTLTKDYLNEVGKEKSIELFYIFYDKKDNTHPTVKGGKAFAELFIQDVKKQNLEIAKLFK
jgi:lysophospholipase L1-like esterase